MAYHNNFIILGLSWLSSLCCLISCLIIKKKYNKNNHLSHINDIKWHTCRWALNWIEIIQSYINWSFNTFFIFFTISVKVIFTTQREEYMTSLDPIWLRGRVTYLGIRQNGRVIMIVSIEHRKDSHDEPNISYLNIFYFLTFRKKM